MSYLRVGFRISREFADRHSAICNFSRELRKTWRREFIYSKPVAFLMRNYFSLTVPCQNITRDCNAQRMCISGEHRERFFPPFMFWIICAINKRKRASVIQIDGSLLDVTGDLSMGTIPEKGTREICMRAWQAPHTIWLRDVVSDSIACRSNSIARSRPGHVPI